MLTIHKEGRKIIFITFCILIFLVILLNLIDLTQNVYHFVIYAFLFLFFYWIIYFFRSPKRKIDTDNNIILCPADGKIVMCQEVEEPEYFKDKRLLVSIFMSPMNVHLNRYPVSGKVNYYRYHEGKYLVAWHPKSSVKNERTSIVIQDKKNNFILVRQIAGMVAKRIVCYAKENTNVNQGDELGFIKFGSRVDLFLPLDTNINVKINQKVKGGITHIGSFVEK